VTFDYKDYQVAGALKQMTLTRRVYQKVFLAYITKRFVKFVIMVFLHLEVKAKAFTRETSVKVLEK
jgi:hypothetical protein